MTTTVVVVKFLAGDVLGEFSTGERVGHGEMGGFTHCVKMYSAALDGA